MVDTIILGTIGLDDVETPFGKVNGVLGGSASYSAYACSFFTKPGVLSIIGTDFPANHLKTLTDKMNLDGVEKKGETFRWGGLYEYDMNEAKTLRTELNCLAEFQPVLPESYRNASFVFLGNADPDVQLQVIAQLRKPKLVVMDSMNLWITHKKEKLLEMIKKTNVLLLNDGEARQLFQTVNLVVAAKKALGLGPQAVIIKKGEHGSLLFTKDKHFSCGSYPLEVVKDPTGCGDSFGGAFIGHLAKTGDVNEKNLRRAMVYGSVVASFNAEDFSLHRMQKLKHSEIEQRYEKMKEIREF
ncbi:MAG: PfkB family carbohydrate kinase [Candidatus Micrarchaeota archaeon]